MLLLTCPNFSALLLLEREETDAGSRGIGEDIHRSHWSDSCGRITATCLKEKCGIWPGTSSWDFFSKWE